MSAIFDKSGDGGGSDPHAIKALQFYADCVALDNPQLADDIRRMLSFCWPVDMCQHENGK
jgi:hypothetical protein